MKSIFHILLAFLSIPIVVNSQHNFHYTQYMITPYMFNPAAGGTSADFEVNLGARRQWINFPGAPTSNYLTLHTPLREVKKPHPDNDNHPFHSIGAIAYQDKAGPISRNSLQGSYAYSIPLHPRLRLVTALSLGFVSYNIDEDALVFGKDVEELNYIEKILPDLNLGTWLHNDYFFLGVSYNHILNNNVNFFNDRVSGAVSSSRIPYNLYIINGYDIPLSHDKPKNFDSHSYFLVPAIMFKYAGPGTSSSFDLNLQLHRKNVFRLGTSYRHKEAVSFLAGVTVLRNHYHNIQINYSYDLPTNDIRKGSSGSHEFVLIYKFERKLDIMCPENFW